jgi:hypothetical protein
MDGELLPHSFNNSRFSAILDFFFALSTGKKTSHLVGAPLDTVEFLPYSPTLIIIIFLCTQEYHIKRLA